MFAYFCVCFLRLLSKQHPRPSIQNFSIYYPLIGLCLSKYFAIFGDSFVCVQCCAAHLLRDGDTWVLKKCQSTEYNHPDAPCQDPNPSTATSASELQSTNHYYFILSGLAWPALVWSQSKIVLCTSCLVGWQLPVGSLGGGEGRQGFLLRNHR